MQTNELTTLIVPGVLWTLGLMSVLTWGLLAVKLLQFYRVRMQNTRFQRRFWQAGSLEEGESLSERQPGPMAAVATAGFAVLTGRDISPDNRDLAHKINRSDRLERSLRREIQRQRRALESGLAVLASIGSTAPFIGLFGTVWGIMDALVQIGETGQAGLDTVAGPIGHALIATGFGIAVAVPAVLIYNYFVRQLKLSASLMDEFADDFYSLAQQSGFAGWTARRTAVAAPAGPVRAAG
ncbi:MAG: MotA/TolQ/ExbB proton channel family protein [Pseudomonadota bacterium]|nr:MotA/TolQ/ExbB proton channel family protein [Pseudomonadota bacterium]